MITYAKYGNAVIVDIIVPPHAYEELLANVLLQVLEHVEGYTDIRIIIDCREVVDHLNDLAKIRLLELVESKSDVTIRCVLVLSQEGKNQMSLNFLKRANKKENITVVQTLYYEMAMKWIASFHDGQ